MLTGRMQGYRFTVKINDHGQYFAQVGMMTFAAPDMDHAITFVSSWVSRWTYRPSQWASCRSDLSI